MYIQLMYIFISIRKLYDLYLLLRIYLCSKIGDDRSFNLLRETLYSDRLGWMVKNINKKMALL